MKKVIEVEALSKSYGDKIALEKISFSLEAGEVFGLLGANGAGKSTLIECLLATKKADQGSVSILEMNPEKERKKLFEMVGVQFQDAHYQDKITVRELCEETQSLYKTSLSYQDLLERFGLSDHAKKQVNELSGGQKQRLFIILALIPNPKVVFLDELTTGLDTRARREVWSYLSELKTRGLTIFLTSHFMDEVEILCDHIMILKKGRIIFQGTVAEAVKTSPFENFEDAYLWYTEKEENHENL